jgi:Tfp pilus assembly protein PilX
LLDGCERPIHELPIGGALKPVRAQEAKNSEKGIALLVAMLTLLLVSAIALGLITMSNTETSTSANFRDEQTAFFSARAGAEEVRDRFRSNATNSLNNPPSSAYLPTTLPGTNNGVLYVTNPAGGETVAPWNIAGSNYPDDEICKEVTCASGVPGGSPWYQTASASGGYAASPTMAWKWVRVTAKTNKSATGTSRTASVDGSTSGNLVCWNNTNEVVTSASTCPSNTNPVYVLTALAVTPSCPPGTTNAYCGSRRMLQQEVTTMAPPPIPAALVLDGHCNSSDSNICFDTTHSNNYYIQGGTVPAIGVLDSSSNTIVTNALFRPDHYPGSTGNPSVATLPSSSISPLDTVQGVQNLSDALQSAAGCNAYPIPAGCSNTSVSMSPSSSPPITFVNGDWSNCDGTGILVVTGTLTCSGNSTYNGIIFVIGQGNLVGNGGGNGQFTGAIWIAKTRDSSGNLLSTLGEAIYDWNGGGGNGITYDGSWYSKLALAFGYRVLAQREMMY